MDERQNRGIPQHDSVVSATLQRNFPLVLASMLIDAFRPRGQDVGGNG